VEEAIAEEIIKIRREFMQEQKRIREYFNQNKED